MVDAPGQPLVVVESAQTHTPPDPCAEALASAQVHTDELRQWRQNQPPPALARSASTSRPTHMAWRVAPGAMSVRSNATS